MSLFVSSWNILRKLIGLDWIMSFHQRATPAVTAPPADAEGPTPPRWTSNKKWKQSVYKWNKQQVQSPSVAAGEGGSAKSSQQQNEPKSAEGKVAETPGEKPSRENEESHGRPNQTLILYSVCTPCISEIFPTLQTITNPINIHPICNECLSEMPTRNKNDLACGNQSYTYHTLSPDLQAVDRNEPNTTTVKIQTNANSARYVVEVTQPEQPVTVTQKSTKSRSQKRAKNRNKHKSADLKSRSDVLHNTDDNVGNTPAAEPIGTSATNGNNVNIPKTENPINKIDAILELSNNLCSKIHQFWGPLNDIKPLEDEIESMLKDIKNLVSSNNPEVAENIKQGLDKLLYSKRLLESRASMIESCEKSDHDDSDNSNEATTSRVMTEVTTAAMNALRLYRNMSHEPPATKAKVVVLRGQFTKVQTDLDALKIETDDVEASEARRDVLWLCNEALIEVQWYSDNPEKI